jgi:hypothetical protein
MIPGPPDTHLSETLWIIVLAVASAGSAGIKIGEVEKPRWRMWKTSVWRGEDAKTLLDRFWP